jgi:DNA modification methylase
LIAAEKLGRRARLIELEARYVDVIVRRWQEFTGKEAVLESDGRTLAGIEAERMEGET